MRAGSPTPHRRGLQLLRRHLLLLQRRRARRRHAGCVGERLGGEHLAGHNLALQRLLLLLTGRQLLVGKLLRHVTMPTCHVTLATRHVTLQYLHRLGPRLQHLRPLLRRRSSSGGASGVRRIGAGGAAAAARGLGHGVFVVARERLGGAGEVHPLVVEEDEGGVAGNLLGGRLGVFRGAADNLAWRVGWGWGGDSSEGV